MPVGGVDEFEPVSGGSDVNQVHVAGGELIISRGDGAVDLQVVEHALDMVSLLIDHPVMFDFTHRLIGPE